MKTTTNQTQRRRNFFLLIAAASFNLITSSLLAKEKVETVLKGNLKKVKEEAKCLAKEKNSEAKGVLESLLFSKVLSSYSDDLLPEEDKGKSFDAELAAERTDKEELFPFELHLQEVIQASQKIQEYEGSEDFLLTSKSVLENAKHGIGITQEEEIFQVEEKKIETCIEGGSFIKIIDKERNVTVIPCKTAEMKTCLGHKKTKEFFWESDAKKKVREWQEELFRDSSLKTYTAHIESGGIFKNYHAQKSWTHKDGISCNKNRVEIKILQEEKELDHWETNSTQKSILEALEANIDCVLLQTQEFNPGYREVVGKKIYRDSWNRRLIFSCKPGSDSKCAGLRDRGGVLLKRVCLEEDDFGDCLSWEKTYDLGGKASYSTQRVTFEDDDKLFDLEDFDPSYEKNREFGPVISSFGALENLGESISKKGFDPGNPSIFSGSDSKCRRSFNSKNLFDCCHKKDCEGRGIFIGLDLGRCSQEERNLFEKIQEGKCHHIGPIKKLLMTEHVYCCFLTKLARIIQEEGHKQLGISWGKPEEPNCQGLTLTQLQSLDFEQMDFTDFIEELQEKADAQKLAAKLKAMAEEFSRSLSEAQAKAKTEEKLDILTERIKQIEEK